GVERWCFFAGRRGHRRLVSDWSSDVCSSDLCIGPRPSPSKPRPPACSKSPLLSSDTTGIRPEPRARRARAIWLRRGRPKTATPRSEERRVGKEGRTGRGAGEGKRKEGGGARE